MVHMHISIHAQCRQATLLSREERLEEQRKYGIHFSDDYDYLQHLKEPWMCSMMEPVSQDRSEQVSRNTLITVHGYLFKPVIASAVR